MKISQELIVHPHNFKIFIFVDHLVLCNISFADKKLDVQIIELLI
jgi:hypothetical protein